MKRVDKRQFCEVTWLVSAVIESQSIASATQLPMGCVSEERILFSHVPVDLLPAPLILESGLGKVDRKHAGNPNHTSNATVDEFGRQAIKITTIIENKQEH